MQTPTKQAVGRWLIAGVAGIAMTGLVGSAFAMSSDTAGAAASASAAPTWHYRAHMFQPESMDRGLVGAFHKLNLNAPQQQQVRHILAAARKRFNEQREVARSNFPALSNPGSQDFSRAVQVARHNAVARIDLATQTERQLYDVLTPAQRSQLPSVLSNLHRQWQTAARARALQQLQPFHVAASTEATPAG